MFDTQTLKIVRRAEFPQGSKPWMLRVSPSGKEVWVQTAGGTNNVLDSRTLEFKDTRTLGRSPVTNAWSPDGRYSLVTHADDTWVAVMDARSYKLVKRIDVGQGGANIAFRPDGRYAYVAVSGANSVAVIDMAELELIKHLQAGSQPMGLIILPQD